MERRRMVTIRERAKRSRMENVGAVGLKKHCRGCCVGYDKADSGYSYRPVALKLR